MNTIERFKRYINEKQEKINRVIKVDGEVYIPKGRVGDYLKSDDVLYFIVVNYDAHKYLQTTFENLCIIHDEIVNCLYNEEIFIGE